MNSNLFPPLGSLVLLAVLSIHALAAESTNYSVSPKARQATAADINRRFELLEQEVLAEERLKQTQTSEISRATSPQELGTEIELVARYKKIMRDVIAENGIPKFNGQTDRPVVIHMRLGRNGTIVSSAVSISSGVPQFDQYALQAVERTQRFEILQDLPVDVYERNFRDLDLLLTPNDLR
jgi:TonB family protein